VKNWKEHKATRRNKEIEQSFKSAGEVGRNKSDQLRAQSTDFIGEAKKTRHRRGFKERAAKRRASNPQKMPQLFDSWSVIMIDSR
jgi:hypothetical protein